MLLSKKISQPIHMTCKNNIIYYSFQPILKALLQPSQNVPAAVHLATYKEISAAYMYFTLVRLVFKTRFFQVVVHHCKVQIILIKKLSFFLRCCTNVPLITLFQLHTASLHRFPGDKFSSKLLVQIVTKKYIM